MSRKLDDLDLIAIRELGKSSQKVQDLIQDKNIEIHNLELKQNITFKKLDPAPKPKGDIRIMKLHSREMYSLDETKQEIKKVEEIYADKIKPAMEEKALETDQDHILPSLKEIDKDDLPILVEKGLDAYKEKQVEHKKTLEQSLEFDLDDKSKFEDYPIHYDFEDNSKDMDIDKSPSPSDEYE